MTKFIEMEITSIGKLVLVNVNKITAIIPDNRENVTKVFIEGDVSGDYISVAVSYEDVKALIAKALSN